MPSWFFPNDLWYHFLPLSITRVQYIQACLISCLHFIPRLDPYVLRGPPSPPPFHFFFNTQEYWEENNHPRVPCKCIWDFKTNPLFSFPWEEFLTFGTCNLFRVYELYTPPPPPSKLWVLPCIQKQVEASFHVKFQTNFGSPYYDYWMCRGRKDIWISICQYQQLISIHATLYRLCTFWWVYYKTICSIYSAV